MKNFIKFNDDKFLKNFFVDIQKFSKKTWNEITNETDISRSCLDYYKQGHFLPFESFIKLKSYLSKELSANYDKNIQIIEPRTWLSRGGKRAYKINFNKFIEGRVKGLASIRKIGKSPKTFDFPEFKLSKEICEFIGTFIGDGFFNCYNNKLYHIEFSGDRRFDLEYYTKVIIPIIKKEIPELNPRISFTKDENTMKVRFFSKKLFCFLKQEFGFKPGVKTYTVSIPDRIMNAGEDYINRTIRGIFDTDGCVFLDKRKQYKKPYPRVTLHTASEPLYDQLKNYLSKKFDLNHGKMTHRNIYYIEIYGFDSLKKWISEIGFSNPRHINKLPQ